MSIMKNASIVTVLVVAAACAGKTTETAPENPAHNRSVNTPPRDTRATQSTRETTLAEVGLDPAAMDRSADPCDDFYQFACGGWLENTDIPEDESRWVRSFSEIQRRNELDLKNILTKAAEKPGDSDPVTARLGAYYGACMDEAQIEKAGLSGLAELQAAVARVKNPKTLASTLAKLHRHHVSALFGVGAGEDFKDVTKVIAQIEQGGLGLPDRDYYTKDDDESKKIRQAYVEHVERMLKLGGMKSQEAKRAAQNVMQLETELARASKTRVEQRDPEGMYNKMDVDELTKLAPRFPWQGYFADLGAPSVAEVNVGTPRFVEKMNELVAKTKPAVWRDYLTWHLLDSTAMTLPEAFVNESFQMEATLSGQKEIRERWKRCIRSTDFALGDLLAQPYIAMRFAGGSKEAAEKMVHAIGEVFEKELNELGWMDPETRERARAKRQRMEFLIGYPDKWKVYSFPIDPTAYTKNTLLASAADFDRDLAKIGKPVDRSEWFMTPPTVNAYYHPLRNHMVFPAGILQPPFYSVSAHEPVNMGAMGMVVGHELTHGFDDQGSQFAADGNLENWWDDETKDRFMQKAQCVVEQYESYEPIEGHNLNGKLTLGENIADLGGVKLAFQAYRLLREERVQSEPPVVADGFDEDQQFFLAVGQAWCAKMRAPEAKRRVIVDPHSPPRFRVMGSLANLPEFSDAFQCKPGTRMNPDNKCQVW